MAESRTEQDLDALNVKVDAILAHLGIEVDNKHSERIQNEQRAREYWSEGGEGWLSIHGEPDRAAMKAEKEAAAEADENQKSILATEQQRQEMAAEAARLAEEQRAAEAQAILDAQQEALAMQANQVGEREMQAQKDADAAQKEAEKAADVPNKKGNK